MSGSSSDWARYERWNSALAEVLYSPGRAGAATYLDFEERSLAAVASIAEPAAKSHEAALISAVLGTISIRSGPGDLLRSHLLRLDKWRQTDMLAPPPCLALLGVLSLAAADMRSEGDMRAYNFYGRLQRLLRLTPTQCRWFEQAYREEHGGEPVSSYLWMSLNLWLERNEGNRGLPTAFPIGHEHVGLPLSQALVRETDREKFVDLFKTQGLPAGLVLAPSEMADRIDEWISRRPCPVSKALAIIWSQGEESQTAIAQVACEALAAWRGAIDVAPALDAAGRAVDSVRLCATVGRFPSPALRLTLLIPRTAGTDACEEVVVVDAMGEPASVLPMVAAGTWCTVAAGIEVDMVTVLSHQLRLSVDNLPQQLRRRPRRLVPLRWDDMLNAFVECERLQIGQEALVLCRSDIAEKVAAYLGAAARPGFTRSKKPGVPEGWGLFEGVQILDQGPPGGLVDLHALRPIARAEVRVAGGMRLPGNIAKWLTARPPELRVSSSTDGQIEARVECVRALASPTPQVATRSAAASVLIWDLGEPCPIDGDYRIEVRIGAELVRTETVRLRSADHPAIRTAAIRVDGRSLGSPEVVITAQTAPSADTFRVAPTLRRPLLPSAPPGVPRWYAERKRAPAIRSSASVYVPGGGPSCVLSGAHHIDLPTLDQPAAVEGICRYCGLVKRYPAALRKGKRTAVPSRRTPDFSGVPPVRTETSLDWTVAFDAVCHTGGGRTSALERIAGQTESGALFGDQFLRTLEILGHIEVVRDMATLLPSCWELNPPTLIETCHGEMVLTGYRSEALLVAVDDFLWGAGTALSERSQDNAPKVLSVPKLDAGTVQSLLACMTEASGQAASLIDDSARCLAANLPPLRDVAATLPKAQAFGAKSAEVWDVLTARFEPAVDTGSQGAYRLTQGGRHYIYRSADDLEAGCATVGDARLVKYLAARVCGVSLLGYDEASQNLYVPLGADLPGLYGRAAVLASGRAPVEDLAQRLLRYPQVPPDLAGHLQTLLMD